MQLQAETLRAIMCLIFPPPWDKTVLDRGAASAWPQNTEAMKQIWVDLLTVIIWVRISLGLSQATEILELFAAIA